jgi:hypothetical protein
MKNHPLKITTIILALGVGGIGCKKLESSSSHLMYTPIEYKGEVTDSQGKPIPPSTFAKQGGLLVVVNPAYGKKLPRMTINQINSDRGKAYIEKKFQPEVDPATSVTTVGEQASGAVSAVKNVWNKSGAGSTVLGSMVEESTKSATRMVRDKYNGSWANTPIVVAVDQRGLSEELVRATGAGTFTKPIVRAGINSKMGPQLEEQVGQQSEEVNQAINDSLKKTNDQMFGQGQEGFNSPNLQFGVADPDIHKNWKTGQSPVDSPYRIYRVSQDGTMNMLNAAPQSEASPESTSTPSTQVAETTTAEQ